MAKYIYPETLFVRRNEIATQLKHLESELIEVAKAYNSDESQERVAEEVCDLIHSGESLLRILAGRYGVDVSKVQRQVVEKNRKRVYYPACGGCVALKCADTGCQKCKACDKKRYFRSKPCTERCRGFGPKKEVPDVVETG